MMADLGGVQAQKRLHLIYVLIRYLWTPGELEDEGGSCKTSREAVAGVDAWWPRLGWQWCQREASSRWRMCWGEEPPELVPGPGVESKGRGGIRLTSCFYFWCLLQGTYFISYPTVNQLCDLEYVP